jgi:predicted nucleotidyltransferase component of viral defense system
MAAHEIYRRQAALLVRTLPFIADEPCFALKGGTAINLFVRDMPRLSVDIDLTYVPIEGREQSLSEIDGAMRRIANGIRRGLLGARVAEGKLQTEGIINRLVLRSAGVQVKIEVTPVLRGCVYEPRRMRVSPTVEDAFGYAEATVVSFEDLFAGKMVAALDRQHPRDLFDVRDLLANEGLTPELKRAFIVYLCSHNRPALELLAPRRRNIASAFRSGFMGMSEVSVTLQELLDAREMLLEQAVQMMPEAHRDFLVAFERGEHRWDALTVDGVDRLPAVRWKERNLAKLSGEQREAQARALARVWP